jgi:epoxyqueuosine reductase
MISAAGSVDDTQVRTSPRNPAGVKARLEAKAGELGFSLVGVAAPDTSHHGDFYRAWLERGAHGDMSYLARPDAVARREDLRGTLPTVRSVVMVAHEYLTEGDPDASDASIGLIARYARGRDYHKVVEKKLRLLLAWLREAEGFAGEGRAYVDTGPILERELAQRGGLGWFGKNTMLIHPRRGSWFFLGCLLLDLELAADEPVVADHCGRCTRCLDACPTGALLGRDESGAPRIDARRCISYLTIEHHGSIPRELRPLMGNRIYGCDICQEVCPFNIKFAQPVDEPAFAARGPGEAPAGVEAEGELADEGAGRGRKNRHGGPPHIESPPDPRAAPWHPGTSSPSLPDLMATALDEASWDAFSRGSAIRRAGRAGFARNVAIGLGNWGSPAAVPVLAAALADPEPLVRAHAAWALGRIDSAEARRLLETHRASETHPAVLEELEAAAP